MDEAVATAAMGTVPTIRHADEGRSIVAFGNEILFKLTGEETGGSLTVALAIVPPGGGPPPHVHREEDELFIIVEGRYSFFTQNRWTEVGPGAVVYLPRGSVHTFRNVGEVRSRHWVLTTPSGFERYYARCAEVFAQPGPPDLQRIAEINREHGIEFV